MRASPTWKRLTAGFLAVGLTLAACGDDDDAPVEEDVEVEVENTGGDGSSSDTDTTDAPTTTEDPCDFTDGDAEDPCED